MTQDQIKQAGLVVANQMHEAQMRAERDRQELQRDRRVRALLTSGGYMNLGDLSKALADHEGTTWDEHHRKLIYSYLEPMVVEIRQLRVRDKVKQLLKEKGGCLLLGEIPSEEIPKITGIEAMGRVELTDHQIQKVQQYAEKHGFIYGQQHADSEAGVWLLQEGSVLYMKCISLYDVQEFERRHPQKLVQMPECIRTAEAPKYEEEKSLQQIQLEYAYEIYQENIKNKVKGAIDKACREAAKKYAHHPEKDFLAVTTLKSYVPKYRDWKAGKSEKPTWAWFK